VVLVLGPRPFDTASAVLARISNSSFETSTSAWAELICRQPSKRWFQATGSSVRDRRTSDRRGRPIHVVLDPPGPTHNLQTGPNSSVTLSCPHSSTRTSIPSYRWQA